MSKTKMLLRNSTMSLHIEEKLTQARLIQNNKKGHIIGLFFCSIEREMIFFLPLLNKNILGKW